MAGIRSEMCLNAAKKVFGSIPDIRKVAQGWIESGMSRVDLSHRIEMSQVPDETLALMAESAAWFISDQDLLRNPKGLSDIEIREAIADYLIERFPQIKRYARPNS